MQNRFALEDFPLEVRAIRCSDRAEKQRSPQARWVLAFVALAALPATACAGSPPTSATQPEPAGQRVLIGRPCEELRKAALADAPHAVYLEIANVQSSLARPLTQELAKPVTANQVGALMLEPGKPVNGPWARCSNQACTSTDDATLWVRSLGFPATPAAPLELELELSVDGSGPERTLVRTQDQQPVIATWSTSAGSSSTMVVTPYYLADADVSRKLLMNCKSRPAGATQPE